MEEGRKPLHDCNNSVVTSSLNLELKGCHRLRAVSYFSLQSYCMKKPKHASGEAAKEKNNSLLTLLFCLGSTKRSCQGNLINQLNPSNLKRFINFLT